MPTACIGRPYHPPLTPGLPRHYTEITSQSISAGATLSHVIDARDMALTKCKECGSQISTRATVCPSCGSPNKAQAGTLSTGCGCLLMIVFAVICVGFFSKSDTTTLPTSKASNPASVSRPELKKDATQRAKDEEESIAKLKLDLCVQLEKLLAFKDKQEFKEFGFARSKPYHKWLEETNALRDSVPKGINHKTRLATAAGELSQVGLDFALNKGETKYTRYILPDIKKTVGYADYLLTKRSAAKAGRIEQENATANSESIRNVYAKQLSGNWQMPTGDVLHFSMKGNAIRVSLVHGESLASCNGSLNWDGSAWDGSVSCVHFGDHIVGRSHKAPFRVEIVSSTEISATTEFASWDSSGNVIGRKPVTLTLLRR